MEAEPVEGRGVADVVQPCGGDQVGTILGRDDGAHLVSLSGDGLDVAPAVAEASEQRGGLLLGPGGKLGEFDMADPIRRWWPEEAGSALHQLRGRPVLGSLEVRVGPATALGTIDGGSAAAIAVCAPSDRFARRRDLYVRAVAAAGKRLARAVRR
jgi:hypothetical protein